MFANAVHSITDYCHNYILEPFSEGAARINRAIEGKNLHFIHHPSLAWDERLVDIFTGIFLLIPIINTIIWIFMRTFGEGEKMTGPLSTTALDPWIEAEEIAHRRLNPEIVILPIEEASAQKAPQTFQTEDCLNNNQYTSSWTIETHRNAYIVKRTAEQNESHSIYNRRWQILSSYYKDPSIGTEVNLRREGCTVTAVGKHKHQALDKEFTLKNPEYPLIQQSMGFRPFILDKEKTEQIFYAIHPESFTLQEFVACKEAPVDLPGYGPAIPVTVHLNNFLDFYTLGTNWFHPETGDFLKLEFKILRFASGHSHLLPSKPTGQ
jgi:hypothetical protein